MQTTVERVDDTRVKLTITVEAARVDAAVDAAARELAGTVKVPGFRPGRVPRRVLESRLGKGALLQEAARDALPDFYSEAVQSNDIDVVGPPEFDVETFQEGSDAAFTATVEVRPEIAVPDYAGLQVAHPEWEVTDEEVGEQLDALRERFAELETVERPVQIGDHVVVTVTAERNGTRLDEASAEDVLYEVSDPKETEQALDRELLGASAGAILRFTDTLGEDFPPDLVGAEASFTAIVKEVKRKLLPEPDDDFAITASEFDTIEELREDLRRTMGGQKRAYARQALRAEVVNAVCDLIDVPLPDALVTDEQRFHLQRVAHQAQGYGLDLPGYLAASGRTPEDLMVQFEDEARQTVKAQLVVDAVGRAAGITVQQADLGEEIGRQALRLQRPPEELARIMTASPERISALFSDAFRRKTIDHLIGEVQVLGVPPEEEPDADELEYVSDDPGQMEGATADAALEAADAEAARADAAEETGREPTDQG